jgi:hypothetical protein
MDVATTRVASANQRVVLVRCNGTAADMLKTPACAVIKMGVEDVWSGALSMSVVAACTRSWVQLMMGSVVFLDD